MTAVRIQTRVMAKGDLRWMDLLDEMEPEEAREWVAESPENRRIKPDTDAPELSVERRQIIARLEAEKRAATAYEDVDVLETAIAIVRGDV